MYNPHRATINYTAPDGSITTFVVHDPDKETVDGLAYIAENTLNFPSAHFINAVSDGKVEHPSDK